MVRRIIPILIFLLASSILGVGFCLPEAPLQGAKIVSEGAYFWLEITNNWTLPFGRIMGSDVFLRLPDDFSVHAICINDQETSLPSWAFNDSTMQTVISMNPGDAAEVLLSAPFLSENETIRHFVISVGIIPFSGGPATLIDLPVSVLSLSFSASYDALLNQNSDMNHTINAMQSQINDLNNQVANLTTDDENLNQRVVSLNDEAANLNEQLVLASYLALVATVIAVVVTFVVGYPAIRRRIQGSKGLVKSTENELRNLVSNSRIQEDETS